MSGKYLPRVSRRGASGDGKDFDPVAEIQAEIDDLEYTRETSSLGLTAEKDIVRKMAALKKQQVRDDPNAPVVPPPILALLLHRPSSLRCRT